MRLVFMGTPDAAAPALRAVAEHFDVVAVYTRRDRPRGRGLKLSPSPVKLAASELGLKVVQPVSLRKDPVVEELRAFAPDAIAVVAYGMLLPPDVLGIPKLGCVNVHFSLLPRWRGAAPVERAILAGDDQTGITTMLMDEGLDTGPMLHRVEVEIGPDDTTGTLRERLAGLSGDLLVRTLEDIAAGTVTPEPQDDAAATLAPKLELADAVLELEQPAAELERRIRACSPAPGAHLTFRGARLKVWRATVVGGDGPPATVAEVGKDAIDVQTSDGRLRLLEVQAEGKRRMSAGDFARGQRLAGGESIGTRI